MEVVAAPSGGAPFHDHDVREWSRIDSITGALERARLETDHWSANTINSSHKYGKVVDSRARTDADGALHQSARRQLEVFHSEVPGGRLQVVKTHTVSTSKWTSASVKDGGLLGGSRDFENLQLSLNPLDLTSQKAKASVGRSVARRPPTRQRAKDIVRPTVNPADPLHHAHITAATNLHRVSRLCHQIHETAVRQAFGRRSPRPIVTEPDSAPVSERESGDGSVEIYEIESENNINNNINGHTNLVRTKSNSSDDISLKDSEVSEDLQELQSWKRTSKIRRSLQFPKHEKSAPNKPTDLPESNGSVRKIREELEKGRRLNTALRNNSVDLDALDQILQSISSSGSDKTDDQEPESPRRQKRNSFVTVESIQEVKGRLRRTNSPTNDIYKTDEGIVTEEPSPLEEMSSRVRSYVYGMETLLGNKKPGIGTGSLESRVKLVQANKNEDWYNRRKSYGFETVHNRDDSLKNKNLVESSTDSGICRSTEIVTVAPKRNGCRDEECSEDERNDFGRKCDELDRDRKARHVGQVKRLASTFSQEADSWRKISDWSVPSTELKSTTITIPISKNNNVVDLSWNDADRDQMQTVKRHSIAVDESKYVTRNNLDNSFRRISLALNDQMRQEEDENGMRKTKKVEFCKTEVHFAAESGKVNIVATDDKPPPTQNFRRRRRNSGPCLEEFNKNGLPLLHFGDTFDKSPFANNNGDASPDSIYENLEPRVPPTFALVTVNSSNSLDISEDEKKEMADNEIKGILKNKPIKPKPYHLGESIPFQDGMNVSDDENKWGVRLRHVEKPEVPIWKSTVTVHNYNYMNQPEKGNNEPEFQKLLKNLRPTRKTDYASDGESKFYDSGRSSWSAPETMEPTRDIKGVEHRGYSTKICLREGEATVVENDQFDREEPTIRPRIENLRKDSSERLKAPEVSSLIAHIQEPAKMHSSVNIIRPNHSPSPKRRTPAGRPDLTTSDQLSSPSIVNRNKFAKRSEKVDVDNFKSSFEEKKVSTKQVSDGMVLRQPKKSEMTYFGVNVSPKPVKKINQAVIRKEHKLLDKPDLIRHHKNSPPPCRPRQKTPSPNRSKQKSPVPNLPTSKSSARTVEEPIYDNIKNKYGREFDSSILDELTKAADQILQVVNGYTDDEINNRLTSDEDEESKIKPLETIIEAKSMQQKTPTTRTAPKSTNPKTRTKPTSPASSVESLSRRKPTPDPKSKPCYEKHRRRTERAEKIEHASTKTSTTKARRLQRASSREALLRSNGSSSEDLPAKMEAPRKPRLIKKTKAMQLTISNGLEMKKPSPNSTAKKREELGGNKGEERILNSLPEIRHKTAVSTIRSTSEKTARDRMKYKNEDIRRKVVQKKETSKLTNSSTRSDRDKTARSTTGLHKETVTHRISTANIKKCYRADSATKH